MLKFSVTNKNSEPLSKKLYKWDEETRIFSSTKSGLVLDFNGIISATFITSHECTFTTGEYCIFNTGSGCTFNTKWNCNFNTGMNCTFTTGDKCVFNVFANGTFTTGKNCFVIIRNFNKDSKLVILKEGEIFEC